MVLPGRELLNSTVEVDETYIGGKTEGKRGRGSEGKNLVVVAVEGIDNIVEKDNEKGYEKILGRVRFRCIDDASAENLIPFVCDTVKPGSTIVTDGWAGYNDLNLKGFKHCKQLITGSRKPDNLLVAFYFIDMTIVMTTLFVGINILTFCFFNTWVLSQLFLFEIPF